MHFAMQSAVPVSTPSCPSVAPIVEEKLNRADAGIPCISRKAGHFREPLGDRSDVAGQKSETPLTPGPSPG